MILFILVVLEIIVAFISGIKGAIWLCRSEQDYDCWLDEIDEDFKNYLIEEIKRKRFLAGFHYLITGFLIITANIQAIVI